MVLTLTHLFDTQFIADGERINRSTVSQNSVATRSTVLPAAHFVHLHCHVASWPCTEPSSDMAAGLTGTAENTRGYVNNLPFMPSRMSAIFGWLLPLSPSERSALP